MDGLFSFILVLLIVAVIFGAIWGHLQIGIVDGLNWLLRRSGLSAPRRLDSNKIAKVIETFSTNDQAKLAKGKINYQGEIWNAYCDLELAMKLNLNDKVEIVQNNDLSMTIKNKLN